MRRTLWIPAAAVAALVVLAAAGALWMRLPQRLISGHACTDAAQRFAERLAADPLTNQPPEVASPAQPAQVFQPCEGNADNRYYGGVLVGWLFPEPYPAVTGIEQHYRQLSAAQGWQLSPSRPGRLCGHKTIDGTAVTFQLYDLNRLPHYDAFWVELSFEDLGSRRHLC